MTDEISKKEIDEIIKETNAQVLDGWIDDTIDISNMFCDKTEKEFSIAECIKHRTSPAKEDIFNAFTIGEPKDVKVLILGQDPYPDKKYPQKADGFAFSQNGQTPVVDSLKNIYIALKDYYEKFYETISDKGVEKYSTNLKDWAAKKKNSVLLLNAALTYENDSKIIVHRDAWKPFVNEVIKKIISSKNGNKLVVFLWGVPAQQIFYESIKSIRNYKEVLERSFDSDNDNLEKLKNGKLVSLDEGIKIGNNIIFMTSHPCNRSKWRGFSSNAPNHFKACDDFLCQNGGKGVWKNLWEYINSKTKS